MKRHWLTMTVNPVTRLRETFILHSCGNYRYTLHCPSHQLTIHDSTHGTHAWPPVCVIPPDNLCLIDINLQCSKCNAKPQLRLVSKNMSQLQVITSATSELFGSECSASLSLCDVSMLFCSSTFCSAKQTTHSKLALAWYRELVNEVSSASQDEVTTPTA